MLIAAIGLLFSTLSFAESLSEDLAKINYNIAEQEIDEATSKPQGEQSLPADFFSSLALRPTIDPVTNCEISAEESRPQNARYELLMVSEERPLQNAKSSQIRVVLAKLKIKEEEHPIAVRAKKFFSSQASNKPGSFKLDETFDTGTNIIHYTAPGTTISLDTKVQVTSGTSVDLSNLNKSQEIASGTFKTGVVSELKVKQELGADTTIKANMEALYSNQENGLSALKDVKMELTSIKSTARIDNKFDEQVSSYAEVNFSGNNTSNTTRYLSGIYFNLPDDAEILVFTGYRTQKQLYKEDQDSREFGIEFKSKSGVKVFGRMREDADSNKVYETGVEVKFK